MKAFTNIGLLAMVIITSACSPKAEIETLWVNSLKTDCDAVGLTECLMIQDGEKIDPQAWENFYSPIEGFEYQSGYLYQIQVKKEDVENVAADASSFKFTLVKVLNKEIDPKLRLNDIWVCTSIFGEEVGSREKAITIEFHLQDKRILGSDGCNNFNGGISVVGQDILKLGPIAGTRMMCQDMDMSDKFNKALNKIERYEINDMTLYLYCEEGNELMTLKKVD